jgi:periplasmic mercuric ion binding protein
MKRVLFLIAILFCTTAFAQRKATAKATIKAPGMICDECKDRVELYVDRVDGIISVVADVKKKIIKVQWLTERTSLEQIKTHIANAGFDADDVTANEASYKKLPKCCKYDRPTPPPPAPLIAPVEPPKTAVPATVPATADSSKPKGLKKDIFRRGK